MVDFKLGRNALAALQPTIPIFHLDSEQLFLDNLLVISKKLEAIESTLETRLESLDAKSKSIFDKMVAEVTLKEETTKILNKQGALVDKLSEVYSRLGVIEGSVDAIFADMVGEGTFIAAVAELNLAIGSVVAAIEGLSVDIGGGSAAVVAAIAAQTAAMQSAIINVENTIGFQAATSREALGFQQEETRNVIRSVNNEVIESNRVLGLLESSVARLESEMAVLLAFQQDIKNNTRIIDNSLFVTNTYLAEMSPVVTTSTPAVLTRLRDDVAFIQELLQTAFIRDVNVKAFRVRPV